MATLTIQALTPLHIGSGVEYQADFEYIYFQNENTVAVVDADMVLKILGKDNLSHWVACIDNDEPLLPLLEKRKSDLKAGDISRRLIPVKTAPGKKPIREQLRGGNGLALLPGSSLKGALRTAVWAKTILENEDLVEADNLGVFNFKTQKVNYNDQFLSKQFFGKDPNHDMFRLLQVGDVEFSKTELVRTDVINKKEDGWDIKQPLTQFIEAIPAGSASTVKIRFHETLDNRAKRYFPERSSMLKPEELFPLVNTHTLRILNDEIQYWEEKAGNPEALGNTVEEMQRIADIASACAANECVLRIGWGSGFRFMTGDWHGAMTDDDYERLLKSVRPRHSVDLIFPKSMRFVKGGMPMGFVKLTLQSQQ